MTTQEKYFPFDYNKISKSKNPFANQKVLLYVLEKHFKKYSDKFTIKDGVEDIIVYYYPHNQCYAFTNQKMTFFNRRTLWVVYKDNKRWRWNVYKGCEKEFEEQKNKLMKILCKDFLENQLNQKNQKQKFTKI